MQLAGYFRNVDFSFRKFLLNIDGRNEVIFGSLEFPGPRNIHAVYERVARQVTVSESFEPVVLLLLACFDYIEALFCCEVLGSMLKKANYSMEYDQS